MPQKEKSHALASVTAFVEAGSMCKGLDTQGVCSKDISLTPFLLECESEQF